MMLSQVPVPHPPSGALPGRIGLFIAVDNYIYNPTVFEAQGVKANTQNDIQIQFGLGVPLGGGSGK